MQRTLLALALICTAGISYAQTTSSGPQSPPGGEPIGRNDWVRQPGDQPGPSSGMAMPRGPAMQPMGGGQSMRGGHMGGAPCRARALMATPPLRRQVRRRQFKTCSTTCRQPQAILRHRSKHSTV